MTLTVVALLQGVLAATTPSLVAPGITALFAEVPAPQADAPAPADTSRPVAPPTASAESSPVVEASRAVDRASAAYEYGDIHEVIEAARPVAEGAVPSRRHERAAALRLLGIALYLDGRVEGAETAFVELLRLEPNVRLDRRITRPEVVLFFGDLRRRNRPPRRLAWNFLPPMGQFQNGDRVRGWVFVGVGASSCLTSAVTGALLWNWRLPANQSRHYETAKQLRPVNWVSTGLCAASYLGGVIDGMLRFGRDDDAVEVALLPTPDGVVVGGRF